MSTRAWLGSLVVLFTLLLGACSGLQLESTPIRSVPLSGAWVIDTAASDDVNTAMKLTLSGAMIVYLLGQRFSAFVEALDSPLSSMIFRYLRRSELLLSYPRTQWE